MNANQTIANQTIVNENATTTVLPTVVNETIVRDVKLVEEKIHQREEQHVQPILTRDIEQKEVRQVLQPMHETTVLPTQHATGVLAAENREINNDRFVAPQIVPEAVRIAGAVDVNIVQHAPIVEERIHKQIIEEVQPVLYRDVIQNKETIITQPIHERIVEAPVVIQETRTMVERGVIELGTTQVGTTGLVGNNTGLIGNNNGLVGNNTGLVGNNTGLVGNNTGLVGNNTGLVGQNAGFQTTPEASLAGRTNNIL